MLNTGAIAANWRLQTRSVVTLARSQVYRTERPCSTFVVMQRLARVCQRQLILVVFVLVVLNVILFPANDVLHYGQ